MKQIGKRRTVKDKEVSKEYDALAENDEKAGRSLKNQSLYRNAVYFFIQAMEKYVRSKIFTLVPPKKGYFRNRNKNHSLNNAIEFLMKIANNSDIDKKQISKQIEIDILEEINFSFLHTNSRYPYYSRYPFYSEERPNTYYIIDFDEKDCLLIENKLEMLKKYLEKLY
jgi:hypothetical protein